MKLPDSEQFNFKDCIIAGDECILITPNDMSTKWDDSNARFRSCIVRKSDNFVVSQGFGKFTNFGERPDFQPWDNSWKIEARHKLDGSLLIVSKYKGELIVRTRGTVDARQLPNGHEIDLLLNKYKLFFETIKRGPDDHHRSFLLEWTTPSNIIVLREHDIPTLTLVGVASHEEDLRYATQEYLDDFSVVYGLNRPQKYEYSSVEECIMDVAAWRGKEGVVLYSPDGQTLKKIKADEYCELHKLATGIKGINQVLDVFMVSPKFTKFDEFYKYIEITLDYEIAEKCKNFIDQICEAYIKVKTKMIIVDGAMEYIKTLNTRKEQAQYIMNRCHGWMIPYAFSRLDDKELDDKLLRKTLEHELKI